MPNLSIHPIDRSLQQTHLCTCQVDVTPLMYRSIHIINEDIHDPPPSYQETPNYSEINFYEAMCDKNVKIEYIFKNAIEVLQAHLKDKDIPDKDNLENCLKALQGCYQDIKKESQVFNDNFQKLKNIKRSLIKEVLYIPNKKVRKKCKVSAQSNTKEQPKTSEVDKAINYIQVIIKASKILRSKHKPPTLISRINTYISKSAARLLQRQSNTI